MSAASEALLMGRNARFGMTAAVPKRDKYPSSNVLARERVGG